MAPCTRSSRSSHRSSSDTPRAPASTAALRGRSSTMSSKQFRLQRDYGVREPSNDEEDVLIPGTMGTSREASFTKVITGKTVHHSAYCCRLGLPRRFCEEHKLPKHVTMTDSTGRNKWHMRFQLRGASKSFTISNGWREFSYDHSLKIGDELVFTLVSSSHFRVGFAASDRGRAMYPTREGDEYPWKINYSRRACLSWQQRNIRYSKERDESEDKDPQEDTLGVQTPVQPPEARPIQGMEKATTFVQNIVSVLFPEKLKPTDKNLQSSQAQSSEDRLPKGGRKHSQLNKPMVAIPSKPIFAIPSKPIAIIPSKPIVSLPKESPIEEEQGFCRCKTLLAPHPEYQPRSFPRSLKLSRISQFECKDPDGTTYVQIVDSDSEVAD